MRRAPRVPSNLDIAWMTLFRYDIPEEWEAFLPATAPWRGY